MTEPIFIIDGARTPFLKARNRPGPFAASDLATDAGRALLLRQKFDPTQLDEVILGCAAPSADEVNIGRVAALRMGCGLKVPGWTVMRNCASGMQSIDSAVNNIKAGRSDLVLAGGVDALSRAPLLFSDAMVMWLSNWYAAKTLPQRAALLAKFRPGYLAPVIALMKGLTDPICGLLMGQTAENLAFRFGITRRDMDEFAARSHQRVLAAQNAGHFDGEVVPLYDKSGKLYPADDGVRDDSTPENLAKLRPFFDRKYGNVTAGNSSQITDGGAWLVVASARAVDKHKLDADRPHRRFAVGGARSGADGSGARARGNADTATAESRAQRRRCVGDQRGVRRAGFGVRARVGERRVLPRRTRASGCAGADRPGKLNVDGGAIALGHPVGASGTRIVLHVLNVLRRTNGKRGMAAICIGGGLGGAMLVERV